VCWRLVVGDYREEVGVSEGSTIPNIRAAWIPQRNNIMHLLSCFGDCKAIVRR
jgi:hypothetical protein